MRLFAVALRDEDETTVYRQKNQISICSPPGV